MSPLEHECKECGERLSGRQTHFCSALCKRRAWRRDNRERDNAQALAWKDRNRDNNRARDREYLKRPEQRGVCTICGGPRGSGAARRGEGRCTPCVHKLSLARDQRLVELYVADVSLAQIAAELGTTRSGLGSDLNRLRREGRIGYRYAGWAKRVAA